MPVAESNPVCTHMLRRERQPGGWLLLLLLYVFSPKTVPATVHPRIAFAGLTASIDKREDRIHPLGDGAAAKDSVSKGGREREGTRGSKTAITIIAPFGAKRDRG